MKSREEFMKALGELLDLAKKQGNHITVREVETYFADIDLTSEQTELVFDYLLAQKVVVQGYVKMDEYIQEYHLTDEEKEYLEEYEQTLSACPVMTDQEREKLFSKLLQGDATVLNKIVEIYLQEVITIAKEMCCEQVFIGDMIQEGNIGLLLGVAQITDSATAHETILNQIRQAMQVLLKAQAEVASSDRKMVEKVQLLDEGITNLTEELGRKVTIDELAVYMGMTEDEIEDILKLTGEEAEKADQ